MIPRYQVRYLITIILLLITSVAAGQVTQEWVARYNGPVNWWDAASALAIDADGNVYVTGSSYAEWENFADCTTIKYNSAGDEVWVARYHRPGGYDDEGSALAVGAEGNVYVTGSSFSWYTGYDYVTIKYDSCGNQVWSAQYNGPADDVAVALALDPSGDVYVTGFGWGAGTDYDYITIKYDADGNQVWMARYNGPGNGEDYANDLAVDADANVYVTGASRGSDTNSDYATIKYDCAGNELWVARYDGPGSQDDEANALAVDAQSNVYVAGGSCRGTAPDDYATVKYDSQGNETWVARYNGPGNRHDWATALAVDSHQNIYVTGASYAPYFHHYDYATIKYDSLGNELWVSRYNGPGNGLDFALALALDPGSNIYVTGYSAGVEVSSDYTTVKYSNSGGQLWVARYNGPGNIEDYAYALAADGFGNVYVTGSSYNSDSTSDYATIKYSQQTGVEIGPGGNPVPSRFSLSCHPNPFNASTQITYRLPEAGYLSLNIYNLGGQLTEILVEDYHKAGEYEVLWDASDYPSGIYFYKLTAGDYTETRRMTLLK
jgi:uncharacterized delta-60 repeat protein